jgi:adenylate kinase
VGEVLQLILLGPPGAGKGTQATRIGEEFGVPPISTGEIFREAMKKNTPLGQDVAQYIRAGALVPDELVLEVVRERLAQSDMANGFLLDGFPRTLPQAVALDQYLTEKGQKLTLVIDLEVDPEILVTRLSGRRICQECGVVYHVLTKKEQKPGFCDHCPGHLIQREDDHEATVRKRLTVYTNQTAPLIKYYRDAGLLLQIDGAQPVPAVYQGIVTGIRHRLEQ